MKQYCRYCKYVCIKKDEFYCVQYDKTMAPGTIKRTNNCKLFTYSKQGDVETGRFYHPRKTKEEIAKIRLIDYLD